MRNIRHKYHYYRDLDIDWAKVKRRGYTIAEVLSKHDIRDFIRVDGSSVDGIPACDEGECKL